MTEDMSERKHKALYSLYIAAQLIDRKKLTTAELYEHGGEFQGVELLKSKEDTAALLKTLRDRGYVPHEKEGGAYLNWLSGKGIEHLEKLGRPEGIEDPEEE